MIVKLAVPDTLKDVLGLAMNLIRPKHLAEEIDAPCRLTRLNRTSINELVPRRHLAPQQELLAGLLLGRLTALRRGRRRLRMRVARDARRDRVGAETKPDDVRRLRSCRLRKEPAGDDELGRRPEAGQRGGGVAVDLEEERMMRNRRCRVSRLVDCL